MLGGKSIPLVFRWKLRPFIKEHLQRREVWIHQHIRGDHLPRQLRMLTRLPWILHAPVRAHVVPRPPVEPAFLNMRDVVGHKVVAQHVTFVCRAPQLARDRIDRLAHAVTNPICVHLHKLSLGRELQNIRPMKLLRMRIRIVVVRVRPH